jgi:phospho-N-acetylmuramoyl-pentapeptide-transferase
MVAGDLVRWYNNCIMDGITADVTKMFTLGALSFVLAVFLTPALTHFLYKYKLWRKEVRTKSIDGKELVYFKKFHSEKEVNVPRFGGLLIWVSVTILAVIMAFFGKLSFLSRSQTWLPLFALISASIVGLSDDILQVFGKGKYIAGGLRLKWRLILVALIGLIGAWWFYYKLGYSTIHIPVDGDFFIGAWYIPFFILVMLAVYSGGVVDGLDGLGGGVFGVMFSAFAGIALFNGQVDLATFCLAITGAILAFLWFNIPPARFYMGETGTLGLCCALTVVAFLTDSVLVLPIIGFILVLESGSVILQLVWKKIFKKKLFLAAPLHHHFEALGWPHYKITMRFWVVSVVAALIGLAVRLLG